MTLTTPDLASPPGPGPVLVVGATGTMGGAVLAELLARGTTVRVLVRRRQPQWVGSQVEQVVGDLADPSACSAALEGVSGAFYVSPHEEDEEALARTFVTQAEAAGVRVVFAGVHVSRRGLRSRTRAALFGMLFAAYRPKLRLAAMIEREATDAVLLVPTTFFENDALFLEDIAEGTYPSPLRATNRVSVGDIATVAARVLGQEGFPGGTYPVCGPRTLTGQQCAAAWATALGRAVTYTGDDAEQWARTAERRLPPGRKGRDFRASFGLLGRLRLGTSPDDLATTTRLLGRPPRDYGDYVRTTAATLLADPVLGGAVR